MGSGQVVRGVRGRAQQKSLPTESSHPPARPAATSMELRTGDAGTAAAAVPLWSSEPTNLTRRALRGSRHCDQQECRLTPTAIQHHPLRALSSRQRVPVLPSAEVKCSRPRGVC